MQLPLHALISIKQLSRLLLIISFRVSIQLSRPSIAIYLYSELLFIVFKIPPVMGNNLET